MSLRGTRRQHLYDVIDPGRVTPPSKSPA
jgi:hypothetical protein